MALVEGGMAKQDLLKLLDEVKPVFEKEQSLVRVRAKKAVFVGDTHGDFESSKYVFDNFDTKRYTLIFLGDYVDRGPQQLQNITFLFRRKLENPEKVILLRGNHETQEINRFYGFINELIDRYDEKDAVILWERFNEVFSLMPYGCLVNNRILAIHGGLASGLTTLEQIERLMKGEKDPKNPIAFQLLWNDPREEVMGFAPSDRGGGIMLFGKDVVEEFERRNKISLIIRSHEPVPEGAKYLFTPSCTQSRSRMMLHLKRLLRKAERYPGLLLSVFTCRYYDKCNPAIVVLENRKTRINVLTLGCDGT
ncbi:MAG: metallophosphoesterase [Candidatus Brockarchaeota archaeon]|nr:metallophosphoesterase [Candidatus Brockarchaeota archaeon]